MPVHAPCSDAKPCLAPFGGDISTEGSRRQRQYFAGNMNDAAPLLLLHVGQALLHQQDGTLHEEVEHRLEKIPVVFFERQLRLAAGGVDDKNIDRSQRLVRTSRHIRSMDSASVMSPWTR